MPNATQPAKSAVTQGDTSQPNLPDNQPQEINPPQPPPSKRNPIIVWTLIIVLVLLYVGINVGVYLYGKAGLAARITQFSAVKKQGLIFPPTPTPTITPTPTPTPTFLPPGKGTYTVSQKNHMGPAIRKISFDPLDVHKGETLTITMAVQDTIPVQSVQAVLQTDHGQKNLQFTRIDGTESAGNWQATVTMDDTVWYTYILQVTATDAGGTNSFITAPRS